VFLNCLTSLKFNVENFPSAIGGSGGSSPPFRLVGYFYAQTYVSLFFQRLIHNILTQF